MEYKPKKRWLQFMEHQAPKRKTKLISVTNKETDDMLGLISWDSKWRQYVYIDGDLKLGEGCLYELFEKIRTLRIEREHEF